LSIRNWDIIESNVSYTQGSDVVIVEDTDRLAIGMYVSSGRGFSSDTRIVSIDSNTQITVSNDALENSVYNEATFYMSGINTGTFYDASNLILSNKAYLQEEISEYIYDTYTLPSTDKAKCARDLGYLIDAVTYHLKFGGNRKVVEFAQLYYTNSGYPYGEELTYINRTEEETTAALDAWSKLEEKMVLAMRNQLGVGDYTSTIPFIDNTVFTDTQSPYCAEVESAIGEMISIVQEIISNGTGSVEITEVNQNKPGFWTNTLTYSNYNLIDDPLLPEQECDDVVSSVNSLYDNLQDVFDASSVIRTTPDYVDGQTKVFDLYWENGDPAITEEDEDLLLTINAVLQKPKYNEFYPGPDAYYIDRTVIPNQIVFDVAPIWDQDFGAKNIGEPTAVEKIVGVGIGNYKRLTIDYNLVDGIRSGPFLILDLEDLTVENIEEPDYMFVFVDGVLQRENYSYTVSGPNIYFTVPLVQQNKVDIRYLYGRDIGQILKIYDFDTDGFYAKSKVTVEVTSGMPELMKFNWNNGDFGGVIQAFQFNPDGTFNMIGNAINIKSSGSTLTFNCIGNKAEILPGVDMYFALAGKYTTVNTAISITTGTIEYEEDEDGRTILEDNSSWKGTFFKWRYRNPFVNISDGDLIQVEGQDKFRRIKQIPRKATTKEERPQNQVSNSFYSTVEIERYNGISRGEGLSVVAIIENGVVVGLEWNQRSYNPITQPTAYQYFTPPVLHFIPRDGNGGGARANVLVSKGQVISVDLLDGGSGYTQAPQIVVARRYDVIDDRDIGVSVINAGLNLEINQFSMIASSTVDTLGNQVSGINTFTSIIFDSPVDSDRVITAIIQLVDQNNNLALVGREFLGTTRPELDEIQVLDVFPQTSEYVSVISGRVEDVISNSIVTTGRQITTTISHEIDNTALSNINYYGIGAYLDVDLDILDNIVYIPDTSKFKSNGYLLIGNEVVRYYRKLTDRFLKVQRAENNTTAQFWPAGTFLRQLSDPISSVFGGVSIIESESQTVTMAAGSANIVVSEKQKRVQILTNASITTVSRDLVSIVQQSVNINSVFNISTSVDGKIEVPFDIVPLVTTTSNVSQVSSQIQTIQSDISSLSIFDNVISILEKSLDVNSVIDVNLRVSSVIRVPFNIVSVTTTSTTFEVLSQLQSINSDFNLRKESLELLLIPPPSGVVDGYEESIFITDPINTRLNGSVDLDNDYGVVRRDSTIVYVTNEIFGTNVEYIGRYEKTNAGQTIGNFAVLPNDDGFANVSGLTLQDFSFYYPSITLRDFTDRATSSYTLSGDYFNLTNCSIQDPVAISSSSGSISSTINVQNTTYFPSSGYLFTSGGTVIQYTGKTTTQFTGCTLYRGTNSISIGDVIVPFSIN
jgi:hypothetical protein